jgi:hypothetical protein
MARTRSPNYPALPLKEAAELAQALWKQEKRTTVAVDVAARAWGYTSLSGPARVRLAALKRYGLLEEDRQGVRVSELGMRLALEPRGSEPHARALREAAFRPELFRQLQETHRDASDEALRSHLIFDRQFSEAGARMAIRAFRETLAIAGVAGPARNGAGHAEREAHDLPLAPVAPGEPREVGPSAAQRGRARLFVWPLSRGVVAELRLVGDDIRPVHFEELRRYLSLAMAIVAEDEASATAEPGRAGETVGPREQAAAVPPQAMSAEGARGAA